MRKHRLLIISALMFGISFLAGALGSTQLPKLRAWVLVKIEQTSRDQLPVRILPGAVELSFFPLGAELTNVQVIAKDEIKAFLNTAAVEKVKLSISFWQLFRGRIQLNDLSISGAHFDAKVPRTGKRSGPPLAGLFAAIAKIPVKRIEIEDSGARLILTDPNLILELDSINLVVQKLRGGSITLAVDSGSIQAIEPKTPSQSARASLKIALELDLEFAKNELQLRDLKIRRGDSFFTATGNARGDVEALDFKDAQIKSNGELHLESMGKWARRVFSDLKDFPALKGRAFIQLNAKRAGASAPDVEFTVRTERLQIAKFFVDRVSSKGTLAKEKLSLPKLTIENPSGTIVLSNVAIEAKASQLPEPPGNRPFSAKLEVQRVQLHEFLKSIGVGDIPAFAVISGEVPCTGIIGPDLKVSCAGKARGENVSVRGSMNDPTPIVALREFDAAGSFEVDKHQVTYSTELAMPLSKGRSQGTINYADGFKIFYEGDKVSFKDVANLANLSVEGTARIKGSTEGDSHAATLNFEIDGTDFWLENFWLGNAKGSVSYRAGTLAFTNMQGYYTVSRYSGDVRLDVLKREISINGRSPFFDARDLTKVFSRRVALPFAVTGTGQASVKASGPLALNLLSYDLKSSLFRGSVATETFDQAYFDVKSIGGEVKAERVQVQKGAASAVLTGTGHPEGKIRTAIQGRGFRVEDSVIFSSAGLALSGNIDFEMDLIGPVLAPDANLRGRLSKTSLGDQGMPDSSFEFKIGAKTLQGSANLLGEVIKTKFIVPLEPSAPFAFQLISNEWNFTPVFAAISGTGTRKDYEGRLTSTIDLAAPTGGFWNSTGTMKLDKFSLSRGSLRLASNDQLGLRMTNGQIHVDKFELSGENTYLRITENPKSAAKLDLQVNGKLDLSLLALLTPFFEDLRGLVSLGFNLRGGSNGVDVLGSALVSKGYLKFFDFQHPLEDITIDLLFNQKKILFNTLKAEFGGGRISASGGMEMKGYKNYPVNVAGNFEKVSLNIPDKVRTTGSGALSFTGSWFPFLMKATYEIKEGIWAKEFGADGSDSQGGLRRDQFLPDLLLQERFVPLLVELDIGFQKGLAVKTELVEGRAIGEIQVKGNPTKPSILGQITLDKESKVFFKDTPFEVTTANIQMTDPNEINPKLYIAARSRVQEYDVSLLVQGSVSPKPEISLTSVPPLGEKDIISLLALGATDTQLGSSIKSGEQGTAGGIQATSGLIKKNPISNEIKERFGFDVQFAPGFDESNAVQKIVISRQFANRLGLSASQSLGKSRATDVEGRYRFNDRLSGVLSYQTREATDTSAKERQQKDLNTLGLDLEYKFEFK